MAFPNQTSLADKIISDWQKNPEIKKIVIVAECQSGKTGLLTELARRIKYIVETERGPNFKYFVLGPSDAALAKQTKERFSEQNITSPGNNKKYRYLEQAGDVVFYPSNMHKFMSLDKRDKEAFDNYERWVNRKSEDTFFLFIHDEAHRDSGNKGKINKACKDFGLPALSSPEADNSLMIYVTATPTYDMTNYLRNNEIIHYYMRPGDGYTSLEMLKNSGRILPINLPIKGGKKTPAEIQLDQLSLKVLPQIRLEYPSGGHFVCRVSKAEDIGLFFNALKNQSDLTFCAFLSMQTKLNIIKKYDIEDLEKVLSCKTEKINICFIIGSYRQGKTLDDLQNVIGWYDSSSSGIQDEANDALVIQSVGRNCGYGKTTLQYKIWCNTPSIYKAIDFYKLAVRPINNSILAGSISSFESESISGIIHSLESSSLSGTHSIRSQSKVVTYSIEIFDSASEAQLFAKARKIQCPDLGSTDLNVSIVTLSNNKSAGKDFAADLLIGVCGQFCGKKGSVGGILHVDGPCIEHEGANHIKNWNELKEKKSEYIGKYIYAEPTQTLSLTKFNTKSTGY